MPGMGRPLRPVQPSAPRPPLRPILRRAPTTIRRPITVHMRIESARLFIFAEFTRGGAYRRCFSRYQTAGQRITSGAQKARPPALEVRVPLLLPRSARLIPSPEFRLGSRRVTHRTSIRFPDCLRLRTSCAPHKFRMPEMPYLLYGSPRRVCGSRPRPANARLMFQWPSRQQTSAILRLSSAIPRRSAH
jgi:hypothetical protein